MPSRARAATGSPTSPRRLRCRSGTTRRSPAGSTPSASTPARLPSWPA
nr:MAG TPA: hypothetical protein [Caudoviricetes sp.]